MGDAASSSPFRQVDYRYLDEEVVFDELTTRTTMLPIEPGKYQPDSEPLPKFETFLINPQIYESSSISRPPDMGRDTDTSQTTMMPSMLQAASTPDPVVRPLASYPALSPHHCCRLRQSGGTATTTPDCFCLGYPLMASSPALFQRSDQSSFVTPRSYRTSTTLNSGGEETSSSTDSSVPVAPPNTPVTDWSGYSRAGSSLPLRELYPGSCTSNVSWTTAPAQHCECPTCHLQQSPSMESTASKSSLHHQPPSMEWRLTSAMTAAPVSRSRGRPIGNPTQSRGLRVLKEFHNEMERNRRSRVKNACNAIKKQVPGLGDKTNRATMLEVAVLYVQFVNHVLDRIRGVGSDHQNNDGVVNWDVINFTTGGESSAQCSIKQESPSDELNIASTTNDDD